jgi:conjugal transfer pilus assembly protein TraB
MSFVEDWKNLEPKHRYLLIGMLGFGGLAIVIKSMMAPSTPQATPGAPAPSSAQVGPVNPKDPGFSATTVLPQSPRNQGLESVVQGLQQITDKMGQLSSRMDGLDATVRNKNGAPDRPRDAASSPSGDLDRNLPDSPGPVKFEQPIGPRGKGAAGKTTPEFSTEGDGFDGASKAANPVPPAKRQHRMVEMPSESISKLDSSDDTQTIAVPVNSGIDAVVMTGFNANSAGGTTGQVGAVVSANAVGAPFVTKLKGDVILPNGFRISDLGDCLLSGTAVAKMNAERALATAEALSCVKPNGEIWEAKIRAYAVDNDGTLGIAGKVVSKQGSVLMQAAITGMASGLGAALSPTAIPAVNTNASNGSSTGIQLPSIGSVGYTMVGQGLNNATSQLSKFYLQYANEVMPTVEVSSGTRLTWIFRETVELHHTDIAHKKAQSSS